MAAPKPSLHRLILTGRNVFRRACRNDGLSAAADLLAIQRPVDLDIALDDAHIVPGFDEGDLLGENLGIVDADALGPPLDPRGARIIRGQNVSPFVVPSQQLTKMEGAKLNADIGLVEQDRIPYRIVQL